MPTGDSRVALDQKKLVGLLELREGLQLYLDKKIEEAITKLFTTEAVFQAVDIDITMADVISLSPTSFKSSDGDGNVMDTAGLDSGLVSAVPFENTNAVVYHVGMQYVAVPEGVLDNPATGNPQYRFDKDWVGRKDEPDSVTDNGSTLTFVVDSVFEATRDNTGRKVTVWLKVPATSVESTAIVQATVYFDSGSNKVDVPHHMGQATASTTASDYWVAMEGLRIERDTDLRLESGVVYIGNITGGGSGNPPSAKDTDDQQIYTDPGLVFGDVIEVDANDHHKVAVKAYAAEAASWPQISVVPDGTTDRNMQVQKDGSVVIGNDTFAAGAAKPDLTFERAGPNTLKVSRGTSQWLLTASGTDGIFLDSGFVRINDLISAVSTLQLLDANTDPTQIDFSSATDTDLDANLPSNILGAINNQVTIEQTLAAAFGTSCLSGATSSFTATNGVVAAGTFVVDGKFYSLSAWDNAVTVNTWVFVDSSATPPVYASTTSLPLSDPDDLLVAYFPASGGTPDDAIDCRRLLNRVDDKVEVVVGTTSLSGTKLPGAHFATLTEAFAAINQLEDAELYQWHVRVVGVTEEPSADLPITPPNGTSIVGNVSTGKVTWDSDKALFDMSGTVGVEFRHLVIGHQSGTADPPATPARYVWTASSLVDRCVIKDITWDGSGARVNGLIECTSTWRNSLIENVGGSAGFAADFGFYFDVLDSSVIRGCQMIQGGTDQSTAHDATGIYLDAGSTKSVIEGCKIEGWEGYGIKVNGATVTYCRFANNGITNCDLNGIELVGGQFLTITGNIVWDVGGSETGTAAAIDAGCDDSVITGNSLNYDTSGSPTTEAAIVFPSGANRNVAVGNQLSGKGLSDSGTNNFYQTATDSDPLNGDQTPV